MKKTPTTDWLPADNLILETEALRAVKSETNAIVIAGPGAGKTELLAQRACFLLETNSCIFPKKILAISFKKDAAKNLQERVEKRCGKELSQRFRSMTYDAFAKSLVDRFFLAIPELYRPNSLYDIADDNDIRKAYNLAGFVKPSDWRNNEINKNLRSDIARYSLPFPHDTDLPTERAWQILLKGELTPTARLTFSMITRLASYLIRTNPLIKRSLQLTYSHIFLDEFQDTTEPQYELINICFHKSKSTLTAVGDLKQRIMVWAGAKKDIFSVFAKDFATINYSLSMNHRSAPKLIKLQKAFFSRFDETPIDIKTSEKWDDDDGEAFYHIFESDVQEANTIAEIIERYISKGTHNPEDICVLIKQSIPRYGEKLISALDKLNIKARNEGEYQDLLKEELVVLWINTLSISIKKNASAWKYCCDVLAKMRIIDPDSIHINELQSELKDHLNNIAYNIENIRYKQDVRDILDLIVDFYSISAIQTVFTQYARSNYIEQLKEVMTSHLWNKYLQTSNDFDKTLYDLLGKDTVPIMTIHKSKGLEYKTVIFIGLEDSAFFDFTRNPEENTAAFFVALSRAKETIHFTFSKQRDGIQNRRNINDLYAALNESGIVKEIDHTPSESK
ncbi:ATP-dependent helicase [Paenibacillus wenxiniae]|uniref:DNA 3'-5' helicase n=1 Tax=Paenibacillus wenxiniae TaxID=1636843 RepID=A0ABW4RMR3_9BACL